MKSLLADLRRHEGMRSRLYFDSLGILTVGVGHAMGYKPTPHPIQAAMNTPGVMDTPLDAEVIELLLAKDVDLVDKQIRTLAAMRGVNFETLTPNRQMALINLGFNLGIRGLGGFNKMWIALASRNYAEAATQMKDSLWHRQVGQRAIELETIMEKG